MVRLGIPALIVAGLAMVALYRVGAPMDPPLAGGATGTTRASLEGVHVREVTSVRTFWIGTDGERAFVVLDPDVKRGGTVTIEPGARVTLVGMVRPAPPVAQAMSQWRIDEATARSLAERGTYLHATEIRPPS